MNICMITGEFPPNCGGIGIYVYNLSKKLVNKGHKVTIFTRGSWKNKCIEENIDGIRVFRVLYIPIYPFHVQLHGFFLKKKFELLKNEFDIIHFHSPLIPSFSSTLPTICTLHGTVKGPIDNKESIDVNSMVYKLFSKSFMSQEIQTIRNSDKITTVSNSCAEEINNIYNLEKRIFIVNNGVDTNLFFPNNAKNKKYPFILYTGRLDSGKGLVDLIMAAKILYDENNDIKFILVGDGPIKKHLKKKIEKLGLKNNVHFTGFVPYAKILQYYQNSTIYVFPSYYEGLPTTLLEAMACGVASIATNINGNSELIKNGENGLLVPPRSPEILAKTIMKLLNNESLIKDLGKNARQHIIDNYDWKSITDKLEQIYKSMGA